MSFNKNKSSDKKAAFGDYTFIRSTKIRNWSQGLKCSGPIL